MVFSRVKVELRKVYDLYTGKLGEPGQKERPMCLDEFHEMLGDAGLVDENFGQREIGPCYNLSQQTNKHEHLAQHHLDLYFVEFIEALARVANHLATSRLKDFFPDFKPKNPK